MAKMEAPRNPSNGRSSASQRGKKGQPAVDQAGTIRGPAGVPSAAELQLRRRLSEVELQVRDLEEDSIRRRSHHELEMVSLKTENSTLREQLEAIRMEECMPESKDQRYGSKVDDAAVQITNADSKLLAATSRKYQEAKEEVDRRRVECLAAERLFAAVRKDYAALRARRNAAKRQVFATKAASSAKSLAADHFRSQIHEQMRGLEEQVEREHERLSNLATEAKDVRGEIDGLLIYQSRHELGYQQQCDALLLKRKEIAFLIDVCILLTEERKHILADIEEIERVKQEEDARYEMSFQELMGVAEESLRARAANTERVEELRRQIAKTQTDREALERQNSAFKAKLDKRQRRAAKSQRGSRVRAPEESHESSRVATPFGELRDGRASEAKSVDSSSCAGSAESGEVGTMVQEEIREYEKYFNRLVDIVQSDQIADVVEFIDAAAEERFRTFHDMNHLQKSIDDLRKERAALRKKLRGYTSRPSRKETSSSVIASAVAAARADGSADSSIVSDEHAEKDETRRERMLAMQAKLDTTKSTTVLNKMNADDSNSIIALIVEQVNEVFRGLGCRTADLQKATGLGAVQASTVTAALSIIESRVEEYLVAYANKQDESNSSQKLMSSEVSGSYPQSRSVARALLRRPDLPAKLQNSAVAPHALPRSGDVSLMPTVGSDPKRMASLEDLVEERPLSDAEMKALVQAKLVFQRR